MLSEKGNGGSVSDKEKGVRNEDIKAKYDKVIAERAESVFRIMEARVSDGDMKRIHAIFSKTPESK